MGRYIEKISLNIFDGRFNEEIHFKDGLNLISGENGTGKTNLLTLLQTNRVRQLSLQICVFWPSVQKGIPSERLLKQLSTT